MSTSGLTLRQWFLLLAMLAASSVISVLVLKPAIEAHGRYQVELNDPVNYIPKPLATLPELRLKHTEAWQSRIVSPLFNQSVEAGIYLTEIAGDPSKAVSDPRFPSMVKRIPITVQLSGPYFSIQKFLSQVIQHFPNVVVQMVELKNLGSLPAKDPTIKEDKGSMLLGVVRLDMYVIEKSL
jgi:hypothetical protein